MVIRRWISILVLFAFVSGCSSPRVPVQSDIIGLPVGHSGAEHVLAVGDNVVVVLVNGTEE